MRAVILGVGLSLMVTSVALADGDPAKGEKVFVKCKACHALDKNKIGPHLDGVIGRKAGSIDGFKYSSAMEAKAKQGLVWNDDTLNEWLTNPRKFIPGTKMVFIGLPKPDDRANVIAYLKSAGGK